MDEIVFSLEFDDDSANSRANDYLEKGWKLLHVGTKMIDIYEGQAYYNTAYVVGATKAQYDLYKEEESKPDELISHLESEDI